MDSGRACVLKLGITMAVLMGSFLFYLKFRRYLFRTYVKVGQVSKILFYPVTSCKGVSEDYVRCTKLGINMFNFNDREYVVAKVSDPSTTVQYQSPKLNDVSTFITGQKLVLNYPNQPDITLATNQKRPDKAYTVECLGMEIDGVDCGEAVGSWLETCLEEKELKLCNCKYSWAIEANRFRTVGILVAAESSLREICQTLRFVPPLSVEVFRPNIVVTGSKPLDEKNWDMVFIGKEVAMEMMEFSSKLIVPAWDELNKEWRNEGDPHDDLHELMCIPSSCPTPEFGIYGVVFREGTINVGDPVYVVYKPTLFASLS